MTENEYLELPWNVEDTIDNLKEIKEIMIAKAREVNLDGRAESDAKEISFDFDMAIFALEEIQQCRLIESKRGNVLKTLLNWEWVNTEDVEKFLNISFPEGMKLFEFSRTVEWNQPPLEGQKIITKFRLKNEELIQYRALGTVEELKHITENKAIYMMQEHLELLDDYEELGTIEELREAMEKQRAKKPNIDFHSFIKCSYCQSVLRETDKFCHECGIAIDCSDEK